MRLLERKDVSLIFIQIMVAVKDAVHAKGKLNSTQSLPTAPMLGNIATFTQVFTVGIEQKTKYCNS